jgi:1,4-alpha-glucan branching enzyme
MRLVRSAASALAVFAAIAGSSCAATVAASAPVTTPAGVRFVVTQPEARSVALAGTFNQWSVSSHQMARERPRGPWSIVVPLPPGEHLFMFVVDGSRWITPPLAESYVDDGFGSTNAVVVVRSSER